LKNLVDVGRERETFKADPRKMVALRHLTSLLHFHSLFYEGSSKFSALKAWAITYDYDMETVKEVLGNGKPAETQITENKSAWMA